MHDANLTSIPEAGERANGPLINLKPSLTRWEDLPQYDGPPANSFLTMLPAIDRSELANQTFGDEALAREVLGMFRDQAPELLRALTATAGSARSDIAHRLKGSCAAIGARRAAEASAFLEDNPADPAALAALEARIAEVLRDIAEFGA